MAEKTDDGIIYVTGDGKIAYWNKGCKKIFGFNGREALGQSLDLIIPEKHRQRHWEGFNKVLDSCNTSYNDKLLKVPAIRKDGSKLIIEFSIQPIQDMGECKGFTSIIRDVTPK
jgi:PAS domain S-box-containing protein